jgi:hypothetical protein
MKLFEKVEGMKVNFFHFCLNFQIRTDFEFKILEPNQIQFCFKF